MLRLKEMEKYLENRLSKREKFGNLRLQHTTKPRIDFASNDYIGMALSKRLADATYCEWQANKELQTGLGSTGSRLLTGNSIYAENLENKIAKTHGYESGTLFSCGYMANVGIFSAIANANTTILYDSAVHASTHDGIRLSRAQSYPFRHNDIMHLEKRLKNIKNEVDCFICIESIYSTDGSKAPLEDLCKLSSHYNAKIIIDEAHSIGAIGPEGLGLVAKYGLQNKIFAQINTFGKALGVQGAIILGSKKLQLAIQNFSRSYIYTTALPLQALASIKCSYDLFPHMENERKTLAKLSENFCRTFPHASKTHIQSITLPGNDRVKRLSTILAAQNFYVLPLTSPTVRQGEEMLRICLHSFNNENQLSQLLKLITAFKEV